MILEKEGKQLTLEEFVRETGAPFLSPLAFADDAVLRDIQSRFTKLYKKGEITREQLWLGAYFKKEILSQPLPDVSIRWIDNQLGWGVFALRPFRKMEFIAEYGGKVRKREKIDSKNSYCFEYVVAQGHSTPYNIDAETGGGVARYLNHSGTPNLHSALATFDNISHVILYVKQPIQIGEQLCYDYGPDYWKHRPPPLYTARN